MIRVKNLSLAFDKNQVINDISVDFEESKIHGIVGLNGAGKSTFFSLISRIISADSGEILVNDAPISKREIGFLETNNFFYSRITGKEYLEIFELTNNKYNADVLQEFMKLPLNDLIETYSTGMKKKLALMAMLKQEKSIYLLDEPFNGLDLETNKIVEQIILNLKQNSKTVFMSSHIIDPLLKICDEIHFLENGNFKKHYDKSNFKEIENDLFSKLELDIRAKIDYSNK